MKKALFLTPLLALALASCSNDAPMGDNETYNGPLETNYLSVNILAADNQGGKLNKRAVASDGENSDYENGTGIENAVESVRFYFFDAFGNMVKVSNTTGTLQNYLDWTNPSVAAPGSNPDNNIDEEVNGDKVDDQITTTLIIQTPQGDKLPASVIAVLNPTDGLKSSIASATNLTTFNEVVANFPITTSTTSMVMSNSVYLDENNAVVEAVDVTGFIESSAEAAEGNPATIYVERVNAKVRVDVATKAAGTEGDGLVPVTLTNGHTGYATGVTSEYTGVDGDNMIYVEFLGWNVTCTPNEEFLMKEISSTWTNSGLFGSNDIWNWNSVGRNRSFWAINPDLSFEQGGNYQFGDFTAAQTVKGFQNGVAGTPNYCYVNENAGYSAGDPQTAHPSQVIIAAQLVNKDGDPLTVAEWATINYTQENLLVHLANLADVYQITSVPGEPGAPNSTKHTKLLDPKYFQFVPAENVGKASFDQAGRYFVYLQLDQEACAGMDLTIGDGNAKMDFDAIDEALLTAITPAKIWDEGQTYYYFPIQHLGGQGSNAEFGVVRNHVYACTINSLSGLGTPVFDPNETIVPEKPTQEVNYIAAKIEVLTWRLVNQGVGLAWP